MCNFIWMDGIWIFWALKKKQPLLDELELKTIEKNNMSLKLTFC